MPPPGMAPPAMMPPGMMPPGMPPPGMPPPGMVSSLIYLSYFSNSVLNLTSHLILRRSLGPSSIHVHRGFPIHQNVSIHPLFLLNSSF